ncbi:MAG: acyl-CoA dehydrogenase [Candidatus Proteinoplasmatales archaeon SG8-5]|nr:MAG: acyl-CoA dehydrogenase [Candidatus Proteinoplasmatales archaeon SG8-5]
MDFALTKEQEMVRKTARDFAANELEPIAADIDESAEFPTETVRKLGELGFMGMTVPKEWGGAGLDDVSYVIAIEEISKVCASHGITLSVNNSLVCWPLMAFGTDAQKEKYLKPLASGQKLGCFGLTEPNAGTDAASQATVAEKQGDKYVINGNKIFITNGEKADVAIIFAMTDKSKGTRGISAFIIEKEFPGFSIGTVEKKLGIRGSCTAELVFEDMVVPEQNLLGGEGKGFKVAMATLDGGRIGVAAQALGIAEAAFEASVKYAKEREQFGKPISKFQAIQWFLSDMATEIEAARMLVYRAAFDKWQKRPYTVSAAMAKYLASDVAMKTTRNAIQVHGGYGFTKDYPVERFYRDAKITEIYEGTTEVQKMVISGNLLK